MRLLRDWLERLIFGVAGGRRFTQDSPILPDVWIRYAVEQDPPVSRALDLLFTPHRRASAVQLAGELLDRIQNERAAPGWSSQHPSFESTGFAYNQTTVVARLHFDELLRTALPLSSWWRDYVVKKGPGGEAPDFGDEQVRDRLAHGLRQLARAEARQRGTDITPPAKDSEPTSDISKWPPPAELLWMVRLVGAMLLVRDADETPPRGMTTNEQFEAIVTDHDELAERFCVLMAGVPSREAGDDPLLFMVSVNRAAEPTISLSVLAVKADAARRLFALSCKQINWAILDSGIDATHPAFRKREALTDVNKDPPFGPPRRAGGAPQNNTRVVATYDFTRVRPLLSPDMEHAVDVVIPGLKRNLDAAGNADERDRWQRELKRWEQLAADPRMLGTEAKRLRTGLKSGRAIDWSLLDHLLGIPHDANYEAPVHDHGTHVAGVLAANWLPGDADEPLFRETKDPIVGVCPDINLYDLRVLDDDGRGDEFSIIAALQFVRWLNGNRDVPLIHGVNLSLSIRHDVANFACGRTPVCDEAERLVASGVIVVAAAGNEGYIQYTTPAGQSEGYRSISITDPGNAEAVITVGATHRQEPHTYGVSYFSSRGPTGDGRVKPDLVAPGEKIAAPVPKGLQVKDGTSMAAPHVSGAAALLISRHREFSGQPGRVKQVLCETATDLGRERYFQGSGMLDVLRALQHV
jgi:subtilisin family serine protease